MFDFIRGRFSHQFSSLRRQWCRQQGLPWTDVLSAQRIERALADEGFSFRPGRYTPLVTLWTFLGQVFSPDHSCREAVARLMSWLVGQGESPCSGATGAYCIARQRLPESLLARLVRESGDQLHRQVASPQRSIAGRRVYVVDGTTVSMPDTAANQKAYPQSRSQRPGVGFPIARLVALFSLASGAVLDLAVGTYRGKGTGEPSLFRRLLTRLEPGSVLLGDRYFCSYWNLALLINRDVHGVFRLHQLRKVTRRSGRRLAADDRLVVWQRPARPSWMTWQEYDQL
ncbi:MAG TPA: IS4 family transposase, partial [Pirellulales bacterium]|nr:IS4 family transposase [Pirellulales bacterium]